MLMSLITVLLFGLFLLMMALIFFGQFALTSGHDTWVHTKLRRLMGPQGFKAFMSLYPEALMPLMRAISLIAGILISALFAYYVLSLLAVYLGFNPLGITPAVISSSRQ